MHSNPGIISQVDATLRYHGSIMQPEYATDSIFTDQGLLQSIYSDLIATAVHTVKPDNIAANKRYIARGESTIPGFRKNHLQKLLNLSSRQISRLIKRLMIPKLIRKVQNGYTYYLTSRS